MKYKQVNGIICTPMGVEEAKVSIRAEKTGDFITVSLADDKRNILLQVPYSDIRKVVRSL
jgi:hypothetical protein